MKRPVLEVTLPEDRPMKTLRPRLQVLMYRRGGGPTGTLAKGFEIHRGMLGNTVVYIVRRCT